MCSCPCARMHMYVHVGVHVTVRICSCVCACLCVQRCEDTHILHPRGGKGAAPMPRWRGRRAAAGPRPGCLPPGAGAGAWSCVNAAVVPAGLRGCRVPYLLRTKTRFQDDAPCLAAGPVSWTPGPPAPGHHPAVQGEGRVGWLLLACVHTCAHTPDFKGRVCTHTHLAPRDAHVCTQAHHFEEHMYAHIGCSDTHTCT